MRKTLLLTLLALLGMTQAAAQEYEYVPFVREGVKWTYYIIDYQYHKDYITNPARGDNVAYRTLEIKGDTVINGLTYKKMHKYSGESINVENDTVPVCLREENKKVYAFVPDGKLYDDCIVGNRLKYEEEHAAISSGQEFLLYDFENAIAYWESFDNGWNGITPLSVDTITVGNHLIKRYKDQNNRFTIIEGIGLIGINCSPIAFFMPLATGPHSTEIYGLEKVVENGEVIYPVNFVEDRYMPLIREGVKWVNERVAVNNGDTTCCYYTYEFKGNHPEKFDYGLTCKALYRYEGDHHAIDVDNDSIVAALRENEAIVMTYRNAPLSQVYSQDRNMIGFTGGILYEMSSDYDDMMWSKDYYMMYQREQVLNDDNLVTLEPMIIDGYRCSRLAYLDEQGDTLAYVVEGIGFDSRDMGDLLTPFTRRPDPTADHQEWCGLSHVVKNGQIIYKGMRYRKGVRVGIDEAVADRTERPADPHYYDLTGRSVGTEVPTAPGIYIHQGKKICVSRMP